MVRRGDPVRVLAALVLLVIGVVGVGSTVHAQDEAADDITYVSSCSAGGSGEAIARPQDELLPVNRWRDAAGSFHTRLDAKAWGDLDSKVNRNFVASQALSFGHTLFGIANELSLFASNFDVFCEVGGQADGMAAAIGQAVLESQLLAFVVVSGLVLLLYRARTGGQSLIRSAVRMAVLVGIIGAMTNGAARSSGDQFGSFSPAWFVDRAISTIDVMVARPLQTIAEAASGLSSRNDPTADQGPVILKNPTCVTYERELVKRYKESNPDNYLVAVSMDTLWRESGLSVWEISQFGYTDDGARVGCRLLEDFAGVPGSVQADIQNASSSIMNDWSPGSFEYPGNLEQDWGIIAWATCIGDSAGGFRVSPTWEGVKPYGEGGAEVIGECGALHAGALFNIGGGNDEVGNGIGNDKSLDFDGEGEIRKDTVDALVAREFVLNFQGHTYGSAVAASISYAIASMILLVCFGGLAIAVILGKLVVVAMIPFLIFALLASVWPGKSDDLKVVKFAKFLLGALVFTAMYAFILSLIALISSFIAVAGAGAFGRGSLMASLWVGFSSVVAVVIIHYLAKTIGMPSPFKPSAAVGYAAALVGTGGVIGAGIDRAFGRARGYGRGYSRGLRHRGRGAAAGGAASGASGGDAGDSGGDDAGSRSPGDRDARSPTGARPGGSLPDESDSGSGPEPGSGQAPNDGPGSGRSDGSGSRQSESTDNDGDGTSPNDGDTSGTPTTGSPAGGTTRSPFAAAGAATGRSRAAGSTRSAAFGAAAGAAAVTVTRNTTVGTRSRRQQRVGAARAARDQTVEGFGGGTAARGLGGVAYAGRRTADAGGAAAKNISQRAASTAQRAANPRNLRTAARVGAGGAALAATGGLVIPAVAAAVVAGRLTGRGQRRAQRVLSQRGTSDRTSQHQQPVRRAAQQQTQPEQTQQAQPRVAPEPRPVDSSPAEAAPQQQPAESQPAELPPDPSQSSNTPGGSRSNRSSQTDRGGPRQRGSSSETPPEDSDRGEPPVQAQNTPPG